MSLIRPVQCAVCQRHMPYAGQPGEIQEVHVTVSLPKFQEAVEVKNLHNLFGTETFYIHLSCWNALPLQLHSSKVHDPRPPISR